MSHDPESTLLENEKLPDVLDRASEIEMKTVGLAIQEARKRAIPQQKPDADGNFEIVDCVDCGEDIGYQRLKVAIKNKFCIYCATKQEQRR